MSQWDVLVSVGGRYIGGMALETDTNQATTLNLVAGAQIVKLLDNYFERHVAYLHKPRTVRCELRRSLQYRPDQGATYVSDH